MYRSERVLVVDESCSSPAEPARLTGHVLSPTRGRATLYAESAQKITATQRAVFARFGPDGKFIGSNGYGGGNYDAARGVAIDGSGNMYFTGYTTISPIDFGGGPLRAIDFQDLFVVKYMP